MTDFDPAEFDTHSPAQPSGDDYRLLLTAMQQAGAQGVRAESERLERATAEMARNAQKLNDSARWLHSSAERFREATFAHYAMTFGAIMVTVFAIGFVIRWAQEPKIERQNWGCTAAWDAKKHKCRGEWVRLRDS